MCPINCPYLRITFKGYRCTKYGRKLPMDGNFPQRLEVCAAAHKKEGAHDG